MASKMVINGCDLQDSDIGFSKPQLNAVGGKQIKILNAKTNRSLLIATPLMLTWGINSNSFEDNGRTTYDLSLQFPSEGYETEAQSEFLQRMVEYESKLKDAIMTNSREWLGKSRISPEIVEALWSPMLRYPRNKETLEYDLSRAPTLRVKVPVWEDVFKCELYSPDNELLFSPDNATAMQPPDIITKGVKIAALLQANGIWLANGRCGTTWKLVQAVVKPRESIYGSCQIKLSAEDQQELANDVCEETQETIGDEVTTLDTDADDCVLQADDDDEPKKTKRKAK